MLIVLSFRDGSSPEIQVEQILAVTPILPGQVLPREPAILDNYPETTHEIISPPSLDENSPRADLSQVCNLNQFQELKKHQGQNDQGP